MRTLILIALIATVAFTSRVAPKHSSLHETSSTKLIQELSKSTYGNTLLHLVQLHSMAAGPVQELLEAIEELLSDLNTALEELEFDFNVRTNEHNSLVLSLQQDIQNAEIDIDRVEDVLNNLLVPRRAQLKQKIAQLVENQGLNRKSLAEANLVRQQGHESYEAQSEELNGATAAVDEALALIATLTNPSMIQVKKFQNTLKKIEGKIKSKSRMTPMIKALISLASNQNFSDQGIIGQIVDALNEFRVEVVNALNDLTAQEAQAVVEHEERVEQLDAEYAEFQRGINATNIDLTAVQDKIQEMSAYEAQRVSDRKTYIAQLDLENTQYAEATQIYTDLKNEYLREIAVTEQGLKVVESGDFSGIKL